MVIFINGSINAGKTTVGKILAKKLYGEFIEFDDISDTIPNFDLVRDIPRVIEIGIKKINQLVDNKKDVVAVYPVRPEDYEALKRGLKADVRFVTLSPQLEVVLSKRGTRKLSDWELQRIKYHYRTGINNPDFGIIIDNSDISPEETAEKIIEELNIKLL